ncbi:MAG: GNAT family acetyltransferase [Polyangiales bacterium]
MSLVIRSFAVADQDAVLAVWEEAGITRPWNDPRADIARKLTVQPELFLVGEHEGQVVATVMAGYDGHRGAVYYLAVRPSARRLGFARALMHEVERRLEALGCPKINLNVRLDNEVAHGFYDRLDYVRDPVVTRSKRLIAD